MKQGNAERERIARDRAASVQRHLSYLTVQVPFPVSGLVVKCDGLEVRPVTFGIALPVDPGKHVIEASAPHRRPYRSSLEIGNDGAKLETIVPELQVVSSQSGAPQATVPFASRSENNKAGSWPKQKTWALVSAGIGVVGAGIGTGLLISAASTHSQASSDCDAANICQSSAGKELLQKAHDRANLATVPLGFGILGLATGVALWLTSPSSQERHQPEVGLTFAPNQLGVQGRF